MSKKTQFAQKTSKPKSDTATKETGLGNTKESPLEKEIKNEFKTRAWFFTLNNPKNHGFCSEKHVFEILELQNPIAIVMQLEEGEETHTPHYQGGVYFKHQVSFKTMKALSNAFRWACVGNWKKTILYCTKPETRIGGPWSKNIDISHTISSMPDPVGWQLNVLDIIKGEPDPRKIYWFWEAKGNSGKSSLCTWLMDNRGARVVSGTCKDILYILAELESFPKIIVIDIPRSNDAAHISYQLIEQLKSGRLCSTKYKGVIKRFNIPHILIFANIEPDMLSLSLDRWEIYWINKKKQSLHRKNILIEEESSDECPSDYE